MKRCLLIAFSLVLCASAQLRADDTDIYGTSVALPPNVLIVFDSSGSMTTNDIADEPYDPNVTYVWEDGDYGRDEVYEFVRGAGHEGEDCDEDDVVLFADDISELQYSAATETGCDEVYETLSTEGTNANAIIQDEDGGYRCGGERKYLVTGNYINYDQGYDGSHSTRLEVAQSVIKEVIDETDNVRFGLMKFNGSSGGDLIKECGASKAELYTAIDAITGSGYTPLAETLAEAGLYFAGADGWYKTGDATTQPYTSPMQYRCQQNIIIYMTDGEPTQDNGSPLGTETDYINTDDYLDDDDGESNYLDDVAEYLWTHDANPNYPDPVDAYTDYLEQNIKTHTIGYSNGATGAAALLASTANRGGGDYYTANNVSTLKKVLQHILSQIAEVDSVFVAPTVPVSEMNRTYAGNWVYVGFFKPLEGGRWAGNLKKYGIDGSGVLKDLLGLDVMGGNGIKDTARSYWSVAADGSEVQDGGAGEVMLNHEINGTATRNIYTYTGTSSALSTHASNQFTTGNTAITGGCTYIPSGLTTALINDVRGTGSGAADWMLGDIIHSAPSVVHYTGKTAIYVGSNDGMVHCIDDDDGNELWGFIPHHQLSRLSLLQNSTKDYFVDGPTAVYSYDHDSDPDTEDHRILLFGERRGGQHYYALDVSTYSAPVFLYEVGPQFFDPNPANDPDTDVYEDLGYSWCEPRIRKIKDSISGSDTDVFLLGGGYDTEEDNDSPGADTKGRAVFAIRATDGAKTSLNFNYVDDNTMDHCIIDVSGVDHDSDGITTRVFAGDLGGNLFAFSDDITRTGPVAGSYTATGRTPDGSWPTRFKLFSAPGKKIFYAPDVVEETFGDYLFFGTGDRADPLETTVDNYLYTLKNTWTTGTLTQSDLVDVTEDILQLEIGDTIQTGSHAGETLTAGNIDTIKQEIRNSLTDGNGWYIELEGDGEKIVCSPIVFAGVVYFTTYTPSATAGGADPCTVNQDRGVARLYAVDYLTGEAVLNFDESNDQVVDEETVEMLKKSDRSKTIGTAIPSAPVVAVLEGGPRMLIGVEKGIQSQEVLAEGDMYLFYWRQMFN